MRNVKLRFRLQAKKLVVSIVGVLMGGYASITLSSICPDPGLLESPMLDVNTNSLGGVSLNKTLALLGGTYNIQGAAVDEKTGEIIFVADGDELPVDLRINVDDLVVAARTVFNVDAAGFTDDPGITFTPGGDWITSGMHDVKFSGEVKDTGFGQIMFDADYVLKKLGQGVDENGSLLSGNAALTSLGYQSSAERILTKNLEQSGILINYFIEPLDIGLESCDPTSGSACTQKSFVFSNVEMGVVTWFQDAAKNTLNPDDPTQVPMELRTEALAFAANITENYDSYANVPGFEVLQKLKHLAKVVSVLRWIRDNSIPIDLSFMDNYKVTEVNTPERVNILQLCRPNGGTVVSAAGSGLFDLGGCAGVTIVGGVRYSRENTEVLAISPLFVEEVANSTARPLDPASINELTWSHMYAGNSYKGISLTLAGTEKDGAYSFTEYDLVYPNKSAQPLMLSRHFYSFSESETGFGPGWSPLPYSITFPESNQLACPTEKAQEPPKPICDIADSETIVSYSKVTLRDRVNDNTLTFEFSGYVNVATSGSPLELRPMYLAPEVNDFIIQAPRDPSRPYDVGVMSYEQFDANNRLVKRILFESGITEGGENRFLVNPQYIITYTGAGANYLEYVYNEKNQLTSIVSDVNEFIHLNYIDDRIDSVAYTSSSSGGSQTRSVSYTYENGKLSTVDKSGEVLKYNYADPTDPKSSQLISVENLLTNETMVAWNPDLESRQTDSTLLNKDSLKITSDYNRTDRVTTVTDSVGRVSQTSRDEKGRLIGNASTVNIEGEEVTLTSSLLYEGGDLDGPTQYTNERNISMSITYDLEGNVETVTDVLGRTNEIYRGIDVVDNLPVVVTIDAKNRGSAKKYNFNGKLIRIYRRINVDVANFKNPILDLNGSPIGKYEFSLAYDEAYVVSVEYEVDGSGLVKSISNNGYLLSDYPWISPEESAVLARSVAGKAEAVTSDAGYTTQYSYNSLSKLIRESGPADITPSTIQYYEDGIEQDMVSSISDSVGQTSFTFDKVNRNKTVTNARGVSTTTFYSERNQIERVVELSADGVVLTTQYFYDDFGKMTYKILPNGHRVEYVYDELNRLTKMDELDEVDVEDANNAPVFVGDVEASYSANAGVELSVTFAATDIDSDELTYTLAGDIPDGMQINSETGVLTWTPTTQDNDVRIVVQIVDKKGGLLLQVITLDVADTIADALDNCSLVANEEQRDTDSDGIGNRCDPDLNNDGIINFADLAIFKSNMGTADSDSDFTGDGVVNYDDLMILRKMFGSAPGPSGVTL